MKEIFRSNSPGQVAFLKSLFESEDIHIAVFDEHTSGMMGSIMAVPCRIMILDSDDYDRACALLAEADLKPWNDDA